MEFDRPSFVKQWLSSGENNHPTLLDTAWRRYNQINPNRLAYNDPTLSDLESTFLPALEAAKSTSSSYRTFHLPGSKPPWKATGMTIAQGQTVTILATGRLWRSRLLDLWLGPQFGLWYRLGENGTVFNSTEASITFMAEMTGEIYLGTQFPGQYGDRSGRVQGNLKAYERVEGAFEAVVISWKDDAVETLRKVVEMGDPFGLASRELVRMDKNRTSNLPPDWHFLWFLGVSNIFTEITDGGERAFHCLTEGNVGIIQKDMGFRLTPDTVLSWKWLVSELPSRFREDTTVSHDYLSIVTEFENGRDLTYTWSWELPAGFGYWCPLATWCDREYHVVIRSGTSGLGRWLDEERNVFEDYLRYVGESPPERIVRVWLIAGSRWQRNKGEMIIKGIKLESKNGTVKVL
jgi:hypothetical protein